MGAVLLVLLLALVLGGLGFAVHVLWWIALLLLWIAGAAVCRRFDVWFLSAMAFLISCGQSVYYGEGRHRLAIEPLILPMAAIGLLWLLQRLATFRRGDGLAGR